MTIRGLILQKEDETEFMNTSDVYGDSCLTKATQCLTICFNWLLCGCFRNKRDSQVIPESIEDKSFWEGFEMAFSALKNPIILGRIERGTYDVKIVYINQAAEKFTGYRNIEFNENHPSGIIGKSVTTLMPSHSAKNHAAYVKHWVRNPPSTLNLDESSYSRTSKMSDSEYQNVENIRREVEILNANGEIIRTYARLSFFASQGRGKRVVGVFSIDNIPHLSDISLKDMTIKMQYKDEKNNRLTQIIVTPPNSLREFADDSKWKFQQLGGTNNKEIQEKCKTVIYQQIKEKLCDIATANDLEITLLNRNNTPLNVTSVQRVQNTMIELINTDSSDDNMYMQILPYIDRAVEEQDREILNHTPSFRQPNTP